MLNFANAPNQRDNSVLIPQGTLCWGILKIVRDKTTGEIETNSKPPKTSKYLNCDITIEGGKHDRRHLFTNINTRNDNQVALDIAGGQLKAILEVNRGASDQNPDGYSVEGYHSLDGMKVAVKVGVESSAQYGDKNTVAVFLSPLQTVTDWKRLLAGDCDPDPNAIQAKRGSGVPAAGAPAQTARWAQPAPPVQQPGSTQTPVSSGTDGAGMSPPTTQRTELGSSNVPAQPAPAGGVVPPWLAQQTVPNG